MPICDWLILGWIYIMVGTTVTVLLAWRDDTVRNAARSDCKEPILSLLVLLWPMVVCVVLIELLFGTVPRIVVRKLWPSGEGDL
jgi:hypothetical protein